MQMGVTAAHERLQCKGRQIEWRSLRFGVRSANMNVRVDGVGILPLSASQGGEGSPVPGPGTARPD